MTEITYHIDPLESIRCKGLALRLIKTDKKSALPTNEKELFNKLIKEELNYQREKTGRTPSSESIELVHIKASQAVSVIKEIGLLHKLYFKGKQLVVDFYGKVELHFHIEKLNNQKIKVTGRFKWRDQAVSLSECDFIGPGQPSWFIRGLALKGIHSSVSWSQLQQVYQSSPLILEGFQQTEFLNEIDPDDPDAPKLIFSEGESLESLKRLPDPLPVLILKDRVGAFADLWMEYGPGLRAAFHDSSTNVKQLGKRNREAEKNWEKDLLETDFILKPMSTSHYYCPVDKVAKSLAFLLEIGWQIYDWKGNRVIRQQAVDIAMDQGASYIQIKGKVHYDDYTADLANVLGAFNRRERFVQLGHNTVGLLAGNGEINWEDLAEEGEVVGEEIRVRKSHLGALSSLFDKAQMSPSLQEWQSKLKDFTGIKEALPGPNFQGTLRPYQQQGLNWLSFLADYGFHGLLADDMGLGKTIQILALISLLPANHPHLIVMPTSLLFNWKKEIERFLPNLTPYVHQGPDRFQSAQDLLKFPIIITSYTTLRLDIALFQSVSYGCLILDEAQMIKNAQTQTAQAVCSLQARLRLSLTGTPLENHLQEVWSHFHFLIPDLFGDEQSFAADLQAAQSDNRYLKRIKKKMAPFILRRKKEEVLKDLPERIDQTVFVAMSDKQRALYDRFLASFRGGLLKKVETEGISKHRMEVLEAILRLRQICCHPLLLSSHFDAEENFESAKWEAVEQDLETAIEEGRKVLIYSQFTTMLGWMSQQARQRGWNYTYLDGQTQNRQKAVEDFQENPHISLFFISLKAGGVGLNLTAADYVFIYDPWWNEAVEEQAINRAHRLGRKESVMAKRFITVESIEEKMMKLKSGKRLLMDEVLETEHIPVQLTLEDLSYLLS